MNAEKSLTKSVDRFVLFSVIFLIGFGLAFWMFAEKLKEHQLHQFDLSIISFIQDSITPQNTKMMEFFTFLGSTKAVIILSLISLVVMLLNKKRWETLFFIIAVSCSAIFNRLLKWIFQRARPEIHPLITETGYSFPSGHSMTAIVFYGMLAYLLMLFFEKSFAKIITLLGFAALIITIGVSRIYLGVHYPSDVLAGFSAGGAWLFMCILALRLIVNKRQNMDNPK